MLSLCPSLFEMLSISIPCPISRLACVCLGVCGVMLLP
nr:MAG TPA: hypothetical protein [Caudoviricetes sp.]